MREFLPIASLVRVSLLGLVLAAGGCTAVKPWERDLLARPEMQLRGDATAAALDEQVHRSKEAASGGARAAGAGCGCN